MLIIRRELIEVLSRAALRRFERELLADLKTCYPAKFGQLGEPAVLLAVRDAIKRAPSYGITSEKDVATMAELDLIAGAPFERQKGYYWTLGVLRDTKLTPSGRLAVIMSRMPAE